MGSLYGTSLNVNSPFFRSLTDDEAILSQALQIRFETRRGSLWTDRSYGMCVDDFLNDGISVERIDQLKNEMEAECRKDERVKSATVILDPVKTESGWSIEPEILVIPKLRGSFSMTLPVSKIDGPMLRKDS